MSRRHDKSMGLAANTAFVFGAEIVVKGVRLLTILVLATRFGDEQFGVYVGLVALLQLLAPAAQWGMSHVGVRAIARGEGFSSIWSRVVTTVAGGSVVGTLVAVVLALLLIDASTWVVIAFGVAQLAGMGLAQAGTLAAEAHGRADVSLAVQISGAVTRLTALAVFVGAGGESLETWAVYQLAGMLLWAVATAVLMARVFGGTVEIRVPTREDLRLGAGFVFVQSSATAQTDIDKVILNGFDLEAEAGVYGPGYRVAELATVPLTALVRSTYAEFFRRGAATINEAMVFARRLTRLGVAYGVAAGVALYVSAPIMSVLLGEEFEESVRVVRFLAFIPLVKGVQYFPANVLTGSDHHGLRVRLIAASAALNAALNLAFVRRFGWEAAAASTLAAELFFAAALWIAVRKLIRAEVSEAGVV